MKYVGDLIEEIRRDSRNEDVPTGASQVGIATDDFLRYLNFAQEKCQSIAISAKSTKFNTTKEISLISGAIQYEIPDRVYLDEHILNVEYSHSGNVRDYYEIREGVLSHRNDEPGTPHFYVRRGGSILLCPIFNGSLGAKARVTYDRAVDTLELRRGTITARTIIDATEITTITVNPASDDADALTRAQFVCVNDAFGNVLMYNVPVQSYNSVTGVITMKGFTHTFEPGEVAPIGDFVTVGEYTTTHCKLNHLCERYLAQYCEYKIFRRDSSSDASQARDDMRDTLKELSTSYSETPRDEAGIVIDNSDLIVGVW